MDDKYLDMTLEKAKVKVMEYESLLDTLNCFHGWPLIKNKNLCFSADADIGARRIDLCIKSFPKSLHQYTFAIFHVLAEPIDDRIYHLQLDNGETNGTRKTYSAKTLDDIMKPFIDRICKEIDPRISKEEAKLRGSVINRVPNALAVLNDYLKENGKVPING